MQIRVEVVTICHTSYVCPTTLPAFSEDHMNDVFNANKVFSNHLYMFVLQMWGNVSDRLGCFGNIYKFVIRTLWSETALNKHLRFILPTSINMCYVFSPGFVEHASVLVRHSHKTIS